MVQVGPHVASPTPPSAMAYADTTSSGTAMAMPTDASSAAKLRVPSAMRPATNAPALLPMVDLDMVAAFWPAAAQSATGSQATSGAASAPVMHQAAVTQHDSIYSTIDDSIAALFTYTEASSALAASNALIPAAIAAPDGSAAAAMIASHDPIQVDLAEPVPVTVPAPSGLAAAALAAFSDAIHVDLAEPVPGAVAAADGPAAAALAASNDSHPASLAAPEEPMSVETATVVRYALYAIPLRITTTTQSQAGVLTRCCAVRPVTDHPDFPVLAAAGPVIPSLRSISEAVVIVTSRSSPFIGDSLSSSAKPLTPLVHLPDQHVRRAGLCFTTY